MTFGKSDFTRDKLDIPKSVVDRILRQEIRVESADVLKKLLKQYPNEPFLIKTYADILFKTGIIELPAKMYSKAASLYMRKGQILSSITAKLEEWKISIPTQESIYNLFLDLKKCAKKNTSVNQFFAELSIHEFMVLLSNFKIKQFPSGHVIRNAGDLEDTLWFVVSGTLQDSFFVAIDNNEKQYRQPVIQLSEGDCFGDIYPFNQYKKGQSYIEAVTNIELLGLSKVNLAQICNKYPNVELCLLQLLQIRSNEFDNHRSNKLRMEKRINLPIEFEVDIFLNTSSPTSVSLCGYSKDVSVGGIHLIVDEISVTSSSEVPAFEKILNNASAQVSFQIETLKIKIPGKIRWSRPIVDKGRKTIATGIQFEEISPRLKGLLFSFFNLFEKPWLIN